ncbi:MAG: MmcQ/YjbR family DNA-binding protein [Byssovorax sp.]
MPTMSAARKLRAKLRELALSYPESHEEFPWGESVIKVRGKIFLFLGVDGEGQEVGFGVKLPHSGDIALSLPFFKPTGYGLGKSGWVQAKLGPDDQLPLDMLREWIDESYRAVAPKKLSASLTPITSLTAPMPVAKAKAAARPKPVAKAKAVAKAKPAVKAKAKAKPVAKAKAKLAAKAKTAVKAKSRG